jgi:hypothetical protein
VASHRLAAARAWSLAEEPAPALLASSLAQEPALASPAAQVSLRARGSHRWSRAARV